MIVEMLCTSEHLLASESHTSEPRLRYIPVMITRLLLSLKKASSEEYLWSLGELTTNTMRFAEHGGAMTTKDDSMHPDTVPSKQEGAQSRALQRIREAQV